MIGPLIHFVKRLSPARSLVSYSGAAAAMSVTGMISGLVIMAWMPPDQLGVWKSLLIIQAYVGIAQGGVINGLNRELAFRIGAGESSVERLVGTAQAFVAVASGILIFGAICSFFLFTDPMVGRALPAVFVVVAGGIYLNFLGVTYRAAQRFDWMAIVFLVMAILNIVTLLFVGWLGYYGIPLRVMVLSITNVVLLHMFRPFRVRLGFSRKEFFILMAVGLPLFGVGYLRQVALTFPNTVILLKEGAAMVGVFAPAMAAFGLVVLVPGSIGQYVYARMSYRLGQSGDLGSLWRQAWISSVGSLLISVVMAGGMVVVLPFVIRLYFPRYVASIPAIPWVALAGCFLGSDLFSSALNSMKAWKWIFAYNGFRVTLSWVLPYLFYLVWQEMPMQAVSAGYALAGFFSFGVGMICTYRATHPLRVWNQARCAFKDN